MRLPLKTKIILISYIAVFAALGIYDFARSSLSWADNLIAIVLLGGVMLAGRKYVISPLVAFLIGVVFLPNAIGHLGMYGSPMLNYHWDWPVHVVVSVCYCMAMVSFFLENSICKTLGQAAFLAFVINITFGAFIEAMEYWGYIYIGFGDSYLGFGDGDNSTNFGPWENSSLDTSNNFLGSLIGVALSALVPRKKKR